MSRPLVPGDRQMPWLSALARAGQVVPLKYRTRTNANVLPESTDPDRPLHYIDIGNVDSTGRIIGVEETTFSRAPSRARRLPDYGDTIISTVRTYLRAIAQVLVRDPDLVCSTGFAVIRGQPELDARYLYYWLRSESVIDEICARSTGVSYPAINASEIGSLPVPVPPLDQQRAVAAFLDRKAAAIDALVAKKERLIELLEEKRQALITQAVTKGLDPSVSMKESGIEWIDAMPSGWTTLPIKRLARSEPRAFTDGDWIETPFITESGVRLIQTGNVGQGQYKEQGFRYVSETTFADLRCTEVSPGDVLICRLDGPVGRACLAPALGVKMITSVDNAVLKVSSGHDPRFIVYVLTTPTYLGWVQGLCRVGGGFRFRISRSMLGEFRVPVPPFRDQQAIADRLDSRTKALAETTARLERQIVLLREYRQALISAAVTGKLDVTRDGAHTEAVMEQVAAGA